MKTLKASDMLSDLELVIKTDQLLIEVQWCRVMHKKNEWVIPSHKHHSFEFHFCASGSSVVTFDRHSLEIQPGEFYLTRPGVHHQQQSSSEDHYTEYALNCNITLRDNNHSEGMAVYSVLENVEERTYECREIISLFETMLEEAETKRIGYFNKIKSIITLMLIEATREIYDTKSTYAVPMKIRHYSSRYHEIYAFLKEHLHENLTVNQVAEHIHIGEKQLNRIVSANTKMGVKKLMMALKLNSAKDYLNQTDLQVKEIAHLLGFDNVYYFNRVFKLEEGMTPSEFRLMSKKY